jgi:uncharacterized membrane protein
MRFIHSLIRSHRLLFFSTALSICAISLKQDKALAWYEICNKTSQRVQTAFAYMDRWDNRTRPRAGVSELSPWISEGWWTLDPGQCARVYPHELWRRNQYYYVYAENTRRSFVWSGNNPFCVDRGAAFTIRNADLPINTSSNGLANGCYGGERLERVNFFQVDIGGGRTQNFTTDLTD